MSSQRCPVCHRQAPVSHDGHMRAHQAGSQQCSGTGKPGPALAKRLAAHDEQLREVLLALATFLVLVDTTPGVWNDKPEHGTLDGWEEFGFVAGARAAFFALAEAQPHLLHGTNLVVGRMTEQELQAAQAANILVGD